MPSGRQNSSMVLSCSKIITALSFIFMTERLLSQQDSGRSPTQEISETWSKRKVALQHSGSEDFKDLKISH